MVERVNVNVCPDVYELSGTRDHYGFTVCEEQKHPGIQPYLLCLGYRTFSDGVRVGCPVKIVVAGAREIPCYQFLYQ